MADNNDIALDVVSRKSFKTISTILVIIIIILSYFLINAYKQIAIASESIQSLNKEISSNINDLDHDITEVKAISTLDGLRIDDLESFDELVVDGLDIVEGNISDNRVLSIKLGLQEMFTFGVVTDNFVVEKAMFIGDDFLLVDLMTQPRFSKHTGQGKFSVGDRELRGEILDVNEKVREYYAKYKYELIDFNDVEIRYTIKNYEIGTYENGEFILKGE